MGCPNLVVFPSFSPCLKASRTCFPEFIIVRPELVRLYWLGGDAICDFNLSAANGDTFPVGKGLSDPSSRGDFGFTVNAGLAAGAFTNTDGVAAETGFGADFGESVAVVVGTAAASFVAGETELFPFSACWDCCDAIFDEIFPAANGDGFEVPEEVDFSVVFAGSFFSSSPSTA